MYKLMVCLLLTLMISVNGHIHRFKHNSSKHVEGNCIII